MSSYSRVLMATDLSRQSVNMTDGLTSLCPDNDTSITLAHVFEDDEDADPRSSQYKSIVTKLKNYCNELQNHGYHDIQIVTAKGEPAEQIHTLAEAHNADLIFVASHGKGFIRSAIMGNSTTYDLAKETRQPIFIDKDDADAKKNLMSRILIATDFSKQSLQALNIVRELRHKIEHCLFVHVTEDDNEDTEKAETFLKELSDEIKMFDIDAQYRLVKGIASKEIIAVAEKDDIQIITMAKTGTANRSGGGLGSTSRNLLLNAECALLLIPDPVEIQD